MPQTTAILHDRYELGKVLGHGGMARVHEGRDRQLRRQVAVKVLSPPYDRDRAFVERFRREAHAAARLNHPNIVAVYDSGSDDGTHYIVTELVEGETLADLLKREGALSPYRAVEIATEVCRALAAAHDKGVIHRDVKPGNVMLTPDDRVKVVDFGIARAAGAESVTRTGLVMGSASYLSPEQARGEPGDERSDIYALGCVLYEMLTGRPPFVADTPIAALYQHVNEPVVPPSDVRQIPAALERVVLRCLEKEPSERFASAGELETALGVVGADDSGATMPLPVAAGEPTAPIAPGEETAPVARVEALPARPARRFPWRVAGIVVLALLVLAGLALAFGPIDLRRQDVRDAARSQARSPSETPSAVAEPLTVDEAAAALVATIQAAESADEIEEDAAEKLLDRVDKVMDAYDAGDAEGVQHEIAEFGKELGKATEEGEVSVEAADRIDAALNDLVIAIENDPPVPPSPTEEPKGGPGEGKGEGHGKGDEKGKGHGKGND